MNEKLLYIVGVYSKALAFDIIDLLTDKRSWRGDLGNEDCYLIVSDGKVHTVELRQAHLENLLNGASPLPRKLLEDIIDARHNRAAMFAQGYVKGLQVAAKATKKRSQRKTKIIKATHILFDTPVKDDSLVLNQ